MRLFPVRFLIVAAALVALAGCGHSPRPTVLDYDTYQIVTIGPISYTTPNRVSLVRRAPGIVDHGLGAIEGASMRVEVDMSPPRELGLDADAARRRFLHRMNKAASRSSQHATIKGIERVMVVADGYDEARERIYGSLSLLRSGDVTVLLSIVGPWERRGQIDAFMEDMVPKIVFPAQRDLEPGEFLAMAGE